MWSAEAIELKNLAKLRQKRFLLSFTFGLTNLLYLFPLPVYATTVFDPFHSSIKVFLALLIVLILILALSFLLRKRFSVFQQNDSSSITVVEVKQLLPRKTLIIVEIDGTRYLVGAGSDSVDTIIHLDNKKIDTTTKSEEEKYQS